jgi:hypothetical protein
MLSCCRLSSTRKRANGVKLELSADCLVKGFVVVWIMMEHAGGGWSTTGANKVRVVKITNMYECG